MRKTFTKKLAMALSSAIVAVSAAALECPEHLYMFGPAQAGMWDISLATELTAEGNGVFTYDGWLTRGTVKFTTGRNFDEGTVQYMPEYNGVWLINAPEVEVINSTSGADNYYWVANPGTYTIKVIISEDGTSAYVTSECVGELPPMLAAMGSAVEGNSNTFPTIIYPASEDDVFRFEIYCNLVPNEYHEHLKFAECPGEPQSILHFVPDAVEEGTNYKLVKAGDVVSYQEVLGNENPAHNWYWGFADEDCEPVKVIFDKYEGTVAFEKWYNAAIEEIDNGLNNLHATFIGGTLSINGAEGPVSVYDIFGRLAATISGSNGSVSGLAAGMYIVKAENGTIKVIK